MCTKCSQDRLYCDWNVAIFKFWRLGLKLHIDAHFWWSSWSIFAQNGVTRHSHPQKAPPSRKHVIWAIKCVRQYRGLTCRVDQEKNLRTVKKNSQKCYISRIWGEPPLIQSAPKFACGVSPGPNHVCQISEWNFEGLWFYSGVKISIFLLIFEWPLQ